METMIYEIKKMYLHQRGFIFVMLFISSSICMLLMGDKPTSPAVEENIDQYETYIEQVKGQLSEATEQFLENESRSINDAQVALDKLYDKYYNGEVSENEFTNERSRLEILEANQIGFELVYDQYIYVREKPENRYFLYRNGWDGLLANDNLDFLIVLTILFLAVPVFCHEYESSMDSLSVTMKKGGRHGAIHKVMLVLLSVLGLGLFSAGLRYLFFNTKYGLRNGSFPLQSLAYFSTATKDISLMEAFLCISSIRLLGYLSFAVTVLFLSVTVKKYALTLFLSTVLIVVPFLGLGNSVAKYTLSGSLGLMLGTGFFRGSVYKTDRFADGAIQIFQEIPLSMVFVVVCCVYCTTLAMTIVIVRRRTNLWSLNKAVKSHRTLSIMLVVCAILASLAGCTLNTDNRNNAIYNSRLSSSYENERYKFYMDESDLNNMELVFENKQTGEIHELVRTPLQSSIQVVNAIYGNDQYIYYMKYGLNKSDFKEYIDRVAIVEVDTCTFSERIIYERNIELDRTLFMGTVPCNNEGLLFFHVADAFFIDAGKKYAFFLADDIYQVRLHDGRITSLNIPTNSNIAFDGERIYYIGNRYQLSYYNIRTEEHGSVPGIVTTKFFLGGEEILFLNRLNQDKLYSLSLITYVSQMVLDKTVLDFYYDEEFIYYQDIDDLQGYRIEYKQEEVKREY